LIEGLGSVDRDIDRAETQDREIGDGSLGPVLREQRDAIAGTDAETRKTESDVLHALDECCCRDVVPLAFGTIVEGVLFVVTQDCFED
jgi:hypothetical protein